MAEATCPNQHFRYLISMICIFEDQDLWTTVIIIGNFLLLALTLYLLRATVHRSSQIKNLQRFEAVDATYCVFTYYMVQVCKATLTLLVLYFVFSTIQLFQYDKWGRNNINEKVFYCQELDKPHIVAHGLIAVSSVISILLGVTFHLVLLLLVCEQAAILFIIVSQKHKSVEKIMYDHNNEDRRIRRQERALKWALIVFSSVVIATYSAIETMELLFMAKYVYVIKTGFYVCWVAVILGLGATLCCQMRSHHRYEYNRHKCNMLLTCLLFTLCIAFQFVIEISKFLQVTNLSIATEVNATLAFQEETCELVSRALIPFEVLVFCFRMQNILLVTLIIYVKRGQDVLQGISKLDYLLKVSLFQVYKDPEVGRQFSLASDDLGQRISGNQTFWRDESKRLNQINEGKE